MYPANCQKHANLHIKDIQGQIQAVYPANCQGNFLEPSQLFPFLRARVGGYRHHHLGGLAVGAQIFGIQAQERARLRCGSWIRFGGGG